MTAPVDPPLRIDAALALGRQRLQASPSAALDSEMLRCHVLDRPRSYLFTWPERTLDETQQQAFLALLARRQGGEPVAHLIGEREFYGRPFRVSAATLIPRPDTETLIEQVLELPLPARTRAVDLGTGSGAIGITLALERPGWQVQLVDLSDAALQVAADNAARLGAKVALSQGSWLSGCTGPFDLIVSNPPYIDPDDHHLQQGDVRFEPRTALVAQQQGLADLASIIVQAVDYLAPSGWLVLEHGYDQGLSVRQLLARQGYTEIRTALDLGGNERVTLGQLKQLRSL